MMMNKTLHKLIVIAMSVIGLVLGLWITNKVARAALNDVSWPQIEIVSLVSGLSSPVHLTNAGDNSSRIFVVERSGNVRIIKNGTLQETPFLDITDRVQAGGEEGLLSVAFPPNYSSKGYFYVYYTNQDGDNQVSRFYVSGDPDLADPASEELILYLNHPTHSNHNGGQLVFGPDGYLYIGTGDGGGGGDPDGNAQNPASLLGKILRIDVEYSTAIQYFKPLAAYTVYLPFVTGGSGTTPSEPYRIPADNPYIDTEGYRGEIWALGLRNPWRFSFDRTTGDLYIGDVGQGSWEEVDFQLANSPGGENYGWNEMEGTHCYLPNCDPTGLALPVYEYPTHELGSCSITGGYVYRGPSSPGVQGIYIFADYCNGFITGLQRDGNIWQAQLLLDTNLNISSFGEDEAGHLYLTDISSGTIYQVIEQMP